MQQRSSIAHSLLQQYANRCAEILRERAAIALEAACLSVCDDLAKTMRQGCCKLGDEVVADHIDVLVSLLAQLVRQYSQSSEKTYSEQLRKNRCRVSALTDEGLRKIMEDTATRAAQVVHLLAAASAEPILCEQIGGKRWSYLAEQVLALGYAFAQRAQELLKDFQGGREEVTIDDRMYEDSGSHLLGTRSQEGVSCILLMK